MTAADLSEFTSGFAQTTAGRRSQHRREVASDIVSAAYLRGEFTLPSGQQSAYYFDKYLFETKPTILRRLAEMLAERVPAGVDRLAGMEVGGVALVTAVSLATGVPFVIVRSRAPRTGTAQLRGELHAGERVMLLHDVVDSGTQVGATARKVAEAGGHIAGVLAVVDREAGGGAAIAAAGLHYEPLFTLSELNL